MLASRSSCTTIPAEVRRMLVILAVSLSPVAPPLSSPIAKSPKEDKPVACVLVLVFVPTVGSLQAAAT